MQRHIDQELANLKTRLLQMGALVEEQIERAIGPRTRVLSFSGITSPTGLVMPAREICLAARERGVTTVLDGAHMDGQVPVNLRELGYKCVQTAASEKATHVILQRA